MNPLNWFEKHSAISWIITIIIAGIIFYLSSKTFSSPGTPTTNIYAIIYHFMAFFFLAFFLLTSLIQGKINKPLLMAGIIIAIIYGISDEFHQFFVPGRCSSIKDILTNSAGIFLASAIYSVHCIRCNKKESIVF